MDGFKMFQICDSGMLAMYLGPEEIPNFNHMRQMAASITKQIPVLLTGWERLIQRNIDLGKKLCCSLQGANKINGDVSNFEPLVIV